MSQIDKLTYLPVLFWFLLFFIGFYTVVYSFFVPLVVSIVTAREEEYYLLSYWARAFFSLVASLQLLLSASLRSPRLLILSSVQLLKSFSSYD